MQKKIFIPSKQHNLLHYASKNKRVTSSCMIFLFLFIKFLTIIDILMWKISVCRFKLYFSFSYTLLETNSLKFIPSKYKKINSKNYSSIITLLATIQKKWPTIWNKKNILTTTCQTWVIDLLGNYIFLIYIFTYRINYSSEANITKASLTVSMFFLSLNFQIKFQI